MQMSICGGEKQKLRKAWAVPVLIHGSNLLFPPCSHPVSETESSPHGRIVIIWYYLRFKLEWKLIFSAVLQEEKLPKSFRSEMPKQEVLTAPSVRSNFTCWNQISHLESASKNKNHCLKFLFKIRAILKCYFEVIVLQLSWLEDKDL